MKVILRVSVLNSYRTGHMQIWRMLADGSKPEQLTFDENSNWFAHPSPDNKWIVYIAYTSDEKQAHLFAKQIKLRLTNLETKAIKDLTPVFEADKALSMHLCGVLIIKKWLLSATSLINSLSII